MFLSTVSPSFTFFLPLRLQGKDISAQPTTEAPVLWVPGQQASPSGPCTAGWCICCDPPGTDKALCFSKHGSNPFLPKCNQVPDLRGCFSTASPSARQPALLSGRPGRQDLMCCLVIQPAEDVQCHKLIIWLHAVHIGVTMWKS